MEQETGQCGSEKWDQNALDEWEGMCTREGRSSPRMGRSSSTAQQVGGTVAPQLGRGRGVMGLQGVRRRQERQGRRGREVAKLVVRRGWVL